MKENIFDPWFENFEQKRRYRPERGKRLNDDNVKISKIINQEIGETSEAQIPKDKLKKKDALRVLKKLESVDEKELDENDKIIMNHQSFKGYRSEYLKKYKHNFDEIFDELLDGKHITLDDFYKRCNSPSQFYNQYLVQSFKFACNSIKGGFYNKCHSGKVKIIEKMVEGKKKNVILIYNKA